jgi:hypothetical protein
VAVELGRPEYDAQQGTVHYPARLLDETTGDPSTLASFGPVALFTDPAGGPVWEYEPPSGWG